MVAFSLGATCTKYVSSFISGLSISAIKIAVGSAILLSVCLSLGGCGSYQPPPDAVIPDKSSDSDDAVGDDKCPSSKEDRQEGSAGNQEEIKIDDMTLIASGALLLSGDFPVNTRLGLWEDGIVPYVITQEIIDSPPFANGHIKDRLLEAIAQFESETEIIFVPYDAGKHKYFLEFVSDTFPHSYVGNIFRSGGQELHLTNTVGKLGVMHELAHALGLLHEENRSDRSLFISIHPERMRLDCYEAFIEPVFNTGFNLRTVYDFGSLMHSGSKVCHDPTIGNLPTVESLDADQPAVPAKTGLSILDREEIALIYADEIANRQAAQTPPAQPTPPPKDPQDDGSQGANQDHSGRTTNSSDQTTKTPKGGQTNSPSPDNSNTNDTKGDSDADNDDEPQGDDDFGSKPEECVVAL